MVEIPVSVMAKRNEIASAVESGEFWKPCPGTTKGYLCCGYQIITPLTGCGMYCRYCVLQAYLENQGQVVYENLESLHKELDDKMKAWHGVVRFGTGEFGDSLFLNDEFHIAEKIAAMLEPYPRACIEFKTKSTKIASLSKIKYPNRVVIGFSMNTPEMIAMHEQNTASLQQRLEAAKQCLEMGFWVAFHFDPLIYHDGWESTYPDVVKRIFSTVKDPSKIAWWSMGGFRSAPALKEHLKKRNLHLPLFSSEMVLGEDGKYRYFRPIRTAIYSAMRNEIESHDATVPLYLCMESPEVWESSGLSARIPNGLASCLDQRAREMLGIKSLPK